MRGGLLIACVLLGCSPAADEVSAAQLQPGALSYDGLGVVGIDPALRPFEVESAMSAFEDWAERCPSVPAEFVVSETRATEWSVVLHGNRHPSNPTAQGRNNGSDKTLHLYRPALDDAYRGVSSASDPEVAQMVVAHEVGHWLGAGHPDKGPAVMMTGRFSSAIVTDIDVALVDPDKCVSPTDN